MIEKLDGESYILKDKINEIIDTVNFHNQLFQDQAVRQKYIYIEQLRVLEEAFSELKRITDEQP